jgi:hypothetical protein
LPVSFFMEFQLSGFNIVLVLFYLRTTIFLVLLNSPEARR